MTYNVFSWTLNPTHCTWVLMNMLFDVQSAPSLTTFRLKLKTHLFQQSYPDIVF